MNFATALRVAAFCSYLGSWLIFSLTAILSALPRLQKASGQLFKLSPAAASGTFLQAAGAAIITLMMDAGPLHPRTVELFGALLLSPLAAILFVWAIRSSRDAGSGDLVRTGAYRFVQHPLYLAFFFMLVATGLLASGVIPLFAGAGCYLIGTEIRIREEERDLRSSFGAKYDRYVEAVRWRYLPGIR